MAECLKSNLKLLEGLFDAHFGSNLVSNGRHNLGSNGLPNLGSNGPFDLGPRPPLAETSISAKGGLGHMS